MPNGSASGIYGDEKDKDMDSSHRENEPDDKEYPEADSLTHSFTEADDLSHSSAYTSSEEDIYSRMEGELILTLRVREQPLPPRSAPGGPRRVEGEERIQTEFPIPTRATLTVYQDKKRGELREK